MNKFLTKLPLLILILFSFSLFFYSNLNLLVFTFPRLSAYLDPRLSALIVFAHSEDAELNAEIQKGKELIEKLQRGEITCQNLTDENFHSIGEYAMELMVGGSDHLLMNQMIERMHGKEAEELMHINMGKRFSGCFGSSTTTSIWYGQNFGMPMMGPMMGYWCWNFSNWRGWNILGPIFGIIGSLWLLIILSFPILVLVLLILGIIYLIKKIKGEIKKE